MLNSFIPLPRDPREVEPRNQWQNNAMNPWNREFWCKLYLDILALRPES